MPDITSQTQINFRAGMLADDLAARGAGDEGVVVSELVRRDLERYYYHMRLALSRIDPPFTTGEASLMCDVLNGTRVEPFSAGLLWAEVFDSAEDGYGEKWGVDISALAQRLRGLEPFTALAITDAIERFWTNEAYRIEGPLEGRLAKVGLIR